MPLAQRSFAKRELIRGHIVSFVIALPTLLGRRRVLGARRTSRVSRRVLRKSEIPKRRIALFSIR
jgi:hypothetical protein